MSTKKNNVTPISSVSNLNLSALLAAADNLTPVAVTLNDTQFRVFLKPPSAGMVLRYAAAQKANGEVDLRSEYVFAMIFDCVRNEDGSKFFTSVEQIESLPLAVFTEFSTVVTASLTTKEKDEEGKG